MCCNWLATAPSASSNSFPPICKFSTLVVVLSLPTCAESVFKKMHTYLISDMVEKEEKSTIHQAYVQTIHTSNDVMHNIEQLSNIPHHIVTRQERSTHMGSVEPAQTVGPSEPSNEREQQTSDQVTVVDKSFGQITTTQHEFEVSITRPTMSIRDDHFTPVYTSVADSVPTTMYDNENTNLSSYNHTDIVEISTSTIDPTISPILPMLTTVKDVFTHVNHSTGIYANKSCSVGNHDSHQIGEYLAPSIMACPLIVSAIIIFKLYKKLSEYKTRHQMIDLPIYRSVLADISYESEV